MIKWLFYWNVWIFFDSCPYKLSIWCSTIHQAITTVLGFSIAVSTSFKFLCTAAMQTAHRLCCRYVPGFFHVYLQVLTCRFNQSHISHHQKSGFWRKTEELHSIIKRATGVGLHLWRGGTVLSFLLEATSILQKGKEGKSMCKQG